MQAGSAPLGLAHALVETAHHALTVAADPTRPGVRRAGPRRHDPRRNRRHPDRTRGPAPDVALLPLAGGQWQPGRGGPRLAAVGNTALPDVPLTGELTPAR
ncbi:hypothetical protein ACSNOJ_02380 [Streptomyces sp. URMC 128]|uniref:hypothetical protein n=1 Tax=Streptomyces sp. URMC 128 TaxID=3423404 RepID=UPI003F1C2BB3